jgi:glycosyltransferase involved in cell wall biosynthesis
LIQPQTLNLAILMPVRDDWASAAVLIQRLDEALSQRNCAVEVFLVDDGSVQPVTISEFQGSSRAVQAINVIHLRRNLGHQRAIAVGLAYLQTVSRWGAVLVMDADGEDTPAGVLSLVESYAELNGKRAIFAERSRRSESYLFRVFYHTYRMVHRGLTGIGVRVGNFSIMPAAYLDTLVAMPELWNHYAASVFRSKLPFSMRPIPRGKRIAGESRMNFASLVSHGLSAIAVFGDVVGVRFLIASLLGALLGGLAILAVIIIRFGTHMAIPGWATYAIGTLLVIVIQLIAIATTFSFFMLSNRTNLGFVPLRDYSLFLEKVVKIYPYD